MVIIKKMYIYTEEKNGRHSVQLQLVHDSLCYPLRLQDKGDVLDKTII